MRAQYLQMPKRSLDFLELELHVDVSSLAWMLGTELGLSERAEGALNY